MVKLFSGRPKHFKVSELLRFARVVVQGNI